MKMIGNYTLAIPARLCLPHLRTWRSFSRSVGVLQPSKPTRKKRQRRLVGSYKCVPIVRTIIPIRLDSDQDSDTAKRRNDLGPHPTVISIPFYLIGTLNTG